jgi:hypothetical protein
MTRNGELCRRQPPPFEAALSFRRKNAKLWLDFTTETAPWQGAPLAPSTFWKWCSAILIEKSNILGMFAPRQG